ncbi:MAG: hypothetical protein R3301_14390, partial [Saprospiraceae bacterium]|nr:hypothetical protein [Saprospiraceae bacterium]
MTDTLQITGDTTFCYGTHTILTASKGFATYAWSTGATTQSLFAVESGFYCVTATDQSGTSSEACITVSERPELLPGYDGAVFEVCAGDSIYLTPLPNVDSLIIDGIEYNGQIFGLHPGSYMFVAFDAFGCSDTAVVTVVELPLAITHMTYEFCENDLWCPWPDCVFSGIDTLIGQNGCDSIIHVNVVVIPHKYFSVFLSLCPGDSVQFGNKFYSAPGFYMDTLWSTAEECDTFLTIIIEELPPTEI